MTHSLHTNPAQMVAAQPLPAGHRMGELEITGVLGIGGFGIVYRAFDHALQRVVAVKEYMPAMLAVRGSDLTVSLRGERYSATFQAGQAGFINEARLLAQFDHPCLIKVLRFWEEHGTAYMATPFYEGQTLEQRLAGGRALAEGEILRLLAELLGALETLHRAQCFHRDIALDNILIQPDGRPVLLDFGAARKLIGDLMDDSTIMLKPGYAPIEQYTDDPSLRQGPWTDIYALGAVIHVLVSGELPPAAVVRSIQDNYLPLAGRALGYGQALLQAVDGALQLSIKDRPQNVAAFAALLGLQAVSPGQYRLPDSPLPAVPPPPPGGAEIQPPAPATPPPMAQEPAPSAPAEPPPAERAPRGGFSPRLPVLGVGLLAIGGIAFALLRPDGETQPEPNAQPQPAVAAAPAGEGEPAAEPHRRLPTRQDEVAEAGAAEERERAAEEWARTPFAEREAPPAEPPVAATAPVEASPAGTPPARDGGPGEGAADAVAQAPGLAVADKPREAAAALKKEEKKVAKPKVSPVQVQLRILPWGEVYVGGRRRGVSPPLKTLSLPPGVYRIEVRNGELPPFRTRLVVDPEAGGKQDLVISHRFE
ncbi:Protein kinase [Azotobacter vinelandii CA]|uniref:Protein kinase n=2 Tax=Azotobacter vinelandii TaxID=354 RepID=C1DJS6_AZOVD|nr:serine/threonine-protein kinase [Azotobacter vinelandii]ACO78845.1 Protein kinase [Azotobacter vinelandii DJ]AGK16581.1 Protein kinase [Azotobacter vinelandii CA]AGK20797.1 Protein kinase [Azotobacter vinelandii CA6]WKN19851.1 serine/threonine protein kinase [Azotobacter vinelandii]SFX31513.1 non-specific serine/threonine protein kinase [Azotobacter vinelandii]